MPLPESADHSGNPSLLTVVRLDQPSVPAIEAALTHPDNPRHVGHIFSRIFNPSHPWNEAELGFLVRDIADLKIFLQKSRRDQRYHPSTLQAIDEYLRSQEDQLKSVRRSLFGNTAHYQPHTLTPAEREGRTDGVTKVLRRVGDQVSQSLGEIRPE